MNRLILFLFICTGIIGCVSPKKPIFKTIKSIKIEKIGLREVTLNADAIFENPNALQGTLSLEDLHIFVNDLDVGTISSTTFEVPSKAEFNVPLKGSFSLSKIYKKQQKGLLNSILTAIQTDSIQVHYKGVIRYHLGNFNYPYTIDKKQFLSLKK